eukprot:gene2379-2414_t
MVYNHVYTIETALFVATSALKQVERQMLLQWSLELAENILQPFHSALAGTTLAVEKSLKELLRLTALPGELNRPQQLLDAMRYSTLNAGKRFRPFLLLETARLFNMDGAGVVRAAAALEMVHCYSLIHDDLPAMDNDDLRRGKLTLHKAFDEATAILAGDALLTYAFDVLADEATHSDATIRAKLVVELARSSGMGGMVGGQMYDLAAETADFPLEQDDIQQLQAMKTGALIHFAVIAGGIIGCCDAASLRILSDYGHKLGAAFQIADDILDHTGDEATMGKKVGKDADRNKATLVSLLGLNQARKMCDQVVADAKNALQTLDCPGDKTVLLQAVDFVVSRSS